MAESQWNLQRGGEQFGPFSWNEIVDLARQGRIDPGDLLWRPADPASREARAVPGLLAVMPASASATAAKPWLPAVAIGAVLFLVVVMILLGSRSDDSGGSGNGSADTTQVETTAVPTTAAPTTTVAETTTTAAPTTVAETTTTAAETTTTVEPTTTVKVITAADLVAAFPDPNALPTGWTSEGEVDIEVIPESGPGLGLCGLENRDACAQNYGAVTMARAPRLVAPDSSDVFIGLVAFPTEFEASGFVAATAVQGAACLGGFPFSLVEGPDGPDFFANPAADGTTWNALETYEQPPDEIPGADASFVYESAVDWSARFDGTDYGYREVDRLVYEQYGSIVLIGNLSAVEGFEGFDNFDAPILTTTTEGLLAAMDLYRPDILAKLQAAGLID